MKTLTLDGFAKKTTQLATSVTRKFDEKEKNPSSSFIANALLLPMIMQTFRLSAACVLILLGIALTTVTAVYTNLKELKK
ncbi:MAG: hypothetical protein HOP06_07950 [Methylotenera sp.]|nr:hypothetical protein [Methylotenera sp.]